MKVVCICDSDFGNYYDPNGPEIHFGEIHEVIDFKYWPYDNSYVYEFKGLEGLWYDVRGFAPISEIDETEFNRNYTKTETI